MNGGNDMSQFMDLLSNPTDTRNQIDEFAKTIKGSPKAQVEQLISSGKMSQGQYNMLSKVANLLMKFYQ